MAWHGGAMVKVVVHRAQEGKDRDSQLRKKHF